MLEEYEVIKDEDDSDDDGFQPFMGRHPFMHMSYGVPGAGGDEDEDEEDLDDDGG